MSRSIAHYDSQAVGIARRHLTARFEDVHRQLLPYLPRDGSVADIGAGSGRDADALTKLGFDVTAVEPSAQMRALAHLAQAGSRARWIDDSLPRLSRLRIMGRRFDFILCSAVLMHISPRSLGESFRALRAIAQNHGRVAVSLRDATEHDPPGIFYRHPPAAVRAAAAAAGLILLDSGEDADSLGRSNIVWRWYVFERRAET